MTEPFPQQPQGEHSYMLTDASGRQYPSLAAPVPHAAQPPSASAPPGCHTPHVRPVQQQFSPKAMVTAGAVGALALGAVLVALLLSVAVVAVSVAVASVAVTCCVLVLRSLVSGSGR